MRKAKEAEAALTKKPESLLETEKEEDGDSQGRCRFRQNCLYPSQFQWWGCVIRMSAENREQQKGYAIDYPTEDECVPNDIPTHTRVCQR